jgi:hypothetical protein
MRTTRGRVTRRTPAVSSAAPDDHAGRKSVEPVFASIELTPVVASAGVLEFRCGEAHHRTVIDRVLLKYRTKRFVGSFQYERSNVMPAKTQALIAKIQALPAEQLAEVEDLVDFIATKARRVTALDRLLAIAPALEAAGAPPITEEEIAAEVEAVRAARRSRGAGANRS